MGKSSQDQHQEEIDLSQIGASQKETTTEEMQALSDAQIKEATSGFKRLVDFIKRDVLKKRNATSDKVSKVAKYEKQQETEIDRVKGLQVDRSA